MKNLIFVCINGLRRDSVTREKMSCLYNFSKNCIALQNAVSGHPIEEAFFASLLTGKHFTSTGAFKNGLRIYPDHDTFAKALTDNGYSTAFIGRWPLYGNKLFVPKGRYRLGFDDIFVTFENKKNKTFYCSDTPDKQPVAESEASAQMKIFREALTRFSKAENPYAVFMSLHLPLSRKTDYDTAVATLDGELSDLFTTRENTLTVVTSSYGTLIGKDEKAFSENSVNVPFMISGANSDKMQVSTLIDATDIMPSLLKLLDVPSPVGISGKAKSILSSVSDESSAMLIGTGPVDLFKDGKEWRGLRTERFTYAITKKSGTEYLFDNLSDPLHENDLAGKKEYEDLKNELKRTLYKKMLKISDTFANNAYYKKYWLTDGKLKPVLK